MARPNKEIKRDKRIMLNLTLAEHIAINQLLKDSNLYHSLNEMLRDILLRKQYKTITKDQELYKQSLHLITSTKKIGNNFNQLLKHLNQKKYDTFSLEERNIMISNLQQIKDLFINIDKHISK